MARTAEMTKWRYMIKHDAKIDLNNLRGHIRRFRNAGNLKETDLLVQDEMLDKKITNEAILAGGPKKSISQDWPWAKDTKDVQSHDSR